MEEIGENSSRMNVKKDNKDNIFFDIYIYV